MTTLANVQPDANHIALQNGFARAFQGFASIFASLSRAVAFSRQCEAEFSRQGHIAPETLQRLLRQVQSV